MVLQMTLKILHWKFTFTKTDCQTSHVSFPKTYASCKDSTNV